MRFVSESLPRLIDSGPDGSDPLSLDACCHNYSLGWTVTHPSGVLLASHRRSLGASFSYLLIPSFFKNKFNLYNN